MSLLLDACKKHVGRMSAALPRRGSCTLWVSAILEIHAAEGATLFCPTKIPCFDPAMPA